MSTVSKGCCVYGCPNKTKHQRAPGEKVIAFHKFPEGRFKEEQRNNWIEAVQKLNPRWVFNRKALVCSEHFRDNNFHVKGPDIVLKDTAVPTVFKKQATKITKENQKSSNQQLRNCIILQYPRRKDSNRTSGKKSKGPKLEERDSNGLNSEFHASNESYRSIPLEANLDEPPQPYSELPICSVEVKTEEVDPLDITEVISEGEEVAANNNEWQNDNRRVEKTEEGCFDSNEETQVFSGEEGSENGQQAGATVSTQVESPRQTHSTTTDGQLRLCRTCGAQQHHLVDIYGNEGREKNLSEKINKHLPIKVCVEDCLPLSLCVTCVELLEACSLIRESSQLQDDLLRSKQQVSVPREEVSDDDQRESAETEPLVDKPGTSGGRARKRRRTVVASTVTQMETESGRYKRRRRHEASFDKEDYTSLSFAKLEEILLVKIADNEITVTSEVPLFCDECEEIFEKEYLYRVHQKHHEIRKKMLRYKCTSCSETFLTYYLLNQHKHSKHPIVTIHMCEHCGKTFKRKDHLESHINYRHKPELPYMCHLCSRYYALYTDLKSHIKNHDNTSCNLCNVNFNSYDQLKIHKYTVHSEKRRDKGVIRSTKDPSYRRKNRVFDTTPAMCSICKFSFKNKRFLEHHILFKHPDAPIVTELRIKHHEKQFTCTYCGLSYTTKGSLKHHINTHTKEKLHKCRYCDKTTYHMLALRSHEKSHKTERPFACTFCDMTFKLRFGLLQHIRTHTGEKPFKCQICGRAFAQTTDLKRHVMRHNGNGPVRPPRKKLRCEECGGTFTSSKRLEEHQCGGGQGEGDFLSNVICDGRSVWHAQ